MSMPVILLVGAIALLSACALRGGHAELPIFDAHIHYNHDAWEKTSPREAIALLREAVWCGHSFPAPAMMVHSDSMRRLRI